MRATSERLSGHVMTRHELHAVISNSGIDILDDFVCRGLTAIDRTLKNDLCRLLIVAVILRCLGTGSARSKSRRARTR